MDGMEEYLQLSEMLQAVIDDAVFENDDYPKFIPPISAFRTYTSEPTACTDVKHLAHAGKHHPKLLAHAEKGYIYSYQRFMQYP